MSDNLRRYRAIEKGLCQLYPGEPQGRMRQSLQVMAMFINGIVGSQSTHSRQVAKKTPTGAKVSSREKQLVRWYQNEGVSYESHMLPYVQAIVSHLSNLTLVLVIDGSDIGRNCVTLLVSVVYQSRAIPLLSLVRSGKKGHFPAEMHIELLRQLWQIVPADADVILLGDGEFDSVELQGFLHQAGWHYVCRTAANTLVQLDGQWLRLDEIDLWRGACLPFYEVAFTQQAYGPVLVIAWWRCDCADPVYLVTNLELMEEACRFYRKRMKIETLFSDQKSRGFQLHKSHIADPARLARVMIAACLAYIWIIYLGVLCRNDGWISQIHRTDRCDLSLFQLGLDLLEFFLNEHLPIFFELRLPVSTLVWSLDPL